MSNQCRVLPVAALVSLLALGCVVIEKSSPGEHKRDATAADVERWHTELSNWNRWGKDDEIGAINLITPEKRLEAAQLVRSGVSVSLAHNVIKEKTPDNSSPFEHTMTTIGADGKFYCADRYSVEYHGYAHTHMDSINHFFYKDKMYNGFTRNDVTKDGAQKLSIHKLKNGIFTRGILMDIPSLKGKRYLEPGEPIYVEDLEAWEEKAGVRVASGDVVFISTGRWARRAEKGPWDVDAEGAAGLHVSCVQWLRKRDVAMLGSDAASDVLPSGVEGVSHPVHLLILSAMGVHIFDNCDLENLSRVCAAENRWEFLITAAPLPVEGGTGSPLNPIATF